jgi:hypothetical protein
VQTKDSTEEQLTAVGDYESHYIIVNGISRALPTSNKSLSEELLSKLQKNEEKINLLKTQQPCI